MRVADTLNVSLLTALGSSAPGRLPVIVQSEASECVIACLAMISAFHGNRYDLPILRQRFPISLKGATLKNAMAIATELGFSCRPVRTDLGDLAKLKAPAVLHWNFSHFVVLKKADRRGIVIHDPAVGARRYPWSEVSDHFTGIALELMPKEPFAGGHEQHSLSLRSLLGAGSGLKRSLSLVVELSAIAQLFALVSPFYIQIVVDEVLIKHDADLLITLAVGFALLTLFSVASRCIRSLAELSLVNQLNLLLSVRLFSHLIRLPLEFFSKRPIGDVLSRFGSLRPLQELISGSAVATLIDGFMVIGAIILMMLYSPLLTAVSTLGLAVYGALRLAVYRSYRNRTHDEIVAQAEVESLLVESVQNISSVRSYSKEGQREADWYNKLTGAVDRSFRVRRLEIGHETAEGLCTGLEHLVVIYLGATLVLDGGLTIGMLYAFLAYRSHLNAAVTSLIEQLVHFRMAGLHLERLADIVATPTDSGTAPSSSFRRPLEAGLRAEGLCYQHGAGERAVFTDLELEIPLGSFLAIHGPSGSGKTTLLKLLSGHLKLQMGQLLIDDLPFDGFGMSSYRAATACVLQEDRLLSGSLRDNVTFFDPEPDGERLEQAVRAAMILEDVMAMPMGFDSLVGDMGSALSAGQEQRLLIARALYQQPTILFLDEGTAHLHEALEHRIFENLRELGITCVYISHRQSVVAMADQRIELPDGTLQDGAGWGKTPYPSSLPA